MTTVFTFWEPRGAVIPYVRLCMKTWERALHAHDVVVLDYENLPRYAGDGALDLEVLRRVAPAVQKDAVMVAVLRRCGGVFIDADTLAVRDIAPLLGGLDRADVVMFYPHLAFMAARPGARLLEPWLAAIQRRLAALRHLDAAHVTVPWDHLGNDILYPLMDHIIEAGGRRPFLLAAAERAIGLVGRRIPADGRRTPLTRLVNGVLWRRRIVYFRTIYRDHLTMLDRDRHAFTPERLDRRTRSALAEGYRRYWFESEGDGALRDGQTLIGLHNSWTPDWYKQLSEAEVLAHPCRLSGTLRRLLGR